MKRIVLCVIVVCFFDSNILGFLENSRAVKAYRAGEFKEALTQFESLLTQYPDDAELNYNAGKAAYKEQEYQAAASYFSQAAKQQEITDDFAVQAWFDLGNTQVKLKKWHEALESYEHVLKYDNAHKEAKDMIAKIKKLLEEQQKQQQQEQQDNQEQHQDQHQENDQQENKDNNQSQNNPQKNNKKNEKQQQTPDKNQQQSSEHNESEGEPQDQDQQEQGDQQENSSDTQDGNSSQQKDKQGQKNKKNQQHGANEKKDSKQGSQQEKQGGASPDDNGKKQDLNGKDAKERGEDVGQEGQPDKSNEDFKQGGGDALEDSIGNIQDHERKESNFDHSASPSKNDAHATKQNTALAGKAQADSIDPFSCDDGIDKNSREGKILQLIEARDAQAAQQLLKMNVQTQRKSGEKNW